MQDLTTGSITRHLLKTASFMLVTMVFQTLYFLVDLYWVGRLGKEAVAAVGIAGNLTFIVLAISQMLGVGTTTLVSHATGRKEHERALLVFNQSQVALHARRARSSWSSPCCCAAPYASTLGADPQTALLARQYLTWFIPAMALQFAMVAMGAALRGTGNFKPGTVVATATVILNMVLAPFLIFGWVTGRAARRGGRGDLVARRRRGRRGLARHLFRQARAPTCISFPSQWVPQFPLWSQMLKIGLPAGAEFAPDGRVLVRGVLDQPAVRRGGAGRLRHRPARGAGGVHAGRRARILGGASRGPEFRRAAGRPGARRPTSRPRRWRPASWRCGPSPATSAPAPIVRLFSGDPQVIDVGAEYLRIIAWTFVGSGLVFVSSSMFQALGNTLPSLAASFGRMLLTAVPAILLARMPGFELRWIWYLSAGTIVFQVIAVLLLLQREYRLRLGSASMFGAASATART